MENRLIRKDDFRKLHKAFCLAFSDYSVDLSPTSEEFDYRIHKKLNIDYELSAASFDGGDMIGFILHTSNLYEGIPTAFNGGTGVIPGFRNQKTGEELYEFLIPKIAAKSVARIILEVVDTNEKAIRLYEKMGFAFKRKFLCYKLAKPYSGSGHSEHIVMGSMDDINEDFADFESSFADCKNQLTLGDECVLISQRDGKVAGYLVFQPRLGRISQVAISRIFRGEGIGSTLIQEAQNQSKRNLTIMNIPEDEIGFQGFLVSCGFQNQVNQFEMELII